MNQTRLYTRFLIAAALLGGILPILFWSIASPGYSWLMIDMYFLDLLPAAVCTALALYYGNRILAVLSVLVTVFYLLVKIGVIVLYTESYLPLTFETLSLLLEHTTHEGVKAMVGEYYLIWAPLCAAAVIAGAVLLARAAAYAVKHQPPRLLEFVLLYTLLCLSANARYIWYRDVNTSVEENYVGHVVTPLTRVFGEIIRDGIVTMRPDLNKDRYGFEPKELSAESRTFLTETGLLPTRTEQPSLLPPFDRILVVAIESMDGDFLNSSGNPALPEGLTPELDAMKQRYLSFPNCYSAAQPTSWGLTALILSRPDYKLDKTMRNTSLCDIFREKGMESIYFSAVDGEFGDNRKYFRRIFRFDKMIFEEEIRRDYPHVDTGSGWGMPDAAMYQITLEYLRKHRPRRYFILVSTMDTHHPYRVSGEKGKDFGDAFFNSIHSADKNIGAFVREFTSDPELFDDRTLLVVTADHSASHGKNHTARKILTDPARIPLIFITKQPLSGIDRNKLFSSIDLPATFARMCGAEIPETFMGQDLTRKKDFALAKDVTETVHLYLPGGREISFSKHHPELRTPEERALFDYYSRFYLLTDRQKD